MEELSKSNSNKYVLPFTLDFGDDILKLFTVRIGSKLIGNCFGSWFCDAIIKIFRVNMFFSENFCCFTGCALLIFTVGPKRFRGRAASLKK